MKTISYEIVVKNYQNIKKQFIDMINLQNTGDFYSKSKKPQNVTQERKYSCSLKNMKFGASLNKKC